MQNVVYLHGQPQPIAQFLRVGSSNHRRLEQMLLAGELPVQRVILEACAHKRQLDLANALKANGRELVLDTNAAELSCVGKYDGAVREAPWANADGVLTPAHFGGSNQFDVLGQIARFAVERGVSRVLAPTHLLSGVQDSWFGVDLQAVRKLRAALDIEGGKQIALDYPVLVPSAVLNDSAERKRLASQLGNLPIESVWLRISGFGAEATPSAIRKYITAVQDFHSLGIPIVVDHIGGLTSLALVAFGAACGFAHGAAERERFDASSWNKPRNDGGGGGGGYTVLLPGIDRLMKKSQAEALIAAPHGRRLLSCNDRRCCPHGFEDTLKDPRGHYLRQRAFQCETLSGVPDAMRTQHFLGQNLAEADRKARQVAKLKVSDEKLGELMVKNSSRLDRMRAVLEDLHRTAEDSTRSKPFPPGQGSRAKAVTDRRN